MPRLTGFTAIEYARKNGLTLNKHADPIEDGRLGLSIGEARDIAAEDPGLIYLDTDPSGLTISNIQLHLPYRVSFEADGRSYDYIIRAGGLYRNERGDPVHRAPNGAIAFDAATTLTDVDVCAGVLGATIMQGDL